MTPGYDRSGLITGIVHIGVGGFHRSHQAMYVDRLLRSGRARDWAICGVGVLPEDAAMRDALRAQDGLYTLVLEHPDGTLEQSTIGSLHEHLYAPDDRAGVIAKLADECTRIVTLTITEGGYDLDRPIAFELLVAGLRARRDASRAPFTVASCDNIEGNGELARACVVEVASRVDHDLGRWVQDEVAFPSSMVDRITPATTDADRRLVRDRFGIDDRIPVMAEPFCQWVLEDRFPAGRPPLEDAGVQLVDDVRPYELMKLRLLNGGHQALAHFGHLLGHREVHAAARDPLLRRLLEHWFAEATPTLPPLPDVDLPAYTTTLLERFANPHISDTIARLCAFTSDRIPTFVLPVARDNLAAGRGSPIAAAIVAAWEAYRRVGDVVDRRASITFVADPVVFGDLGQDRRFVDAVDRARTEIGAHGPRQALVSLLAGAP